MRLLVAAPTLAAVGLVAGFGLLLGVGYLLASPTEELQPSDAIIVISGDEDLSRYREGLTLYQRGLGRMLVFSGAALGEPVSNAEVMRDLAIQEGVPSEHILIDREAMDTYGNARNTREILEDHGLQSAIIVTSPYHLRRAELTFKAAYAGSGIRLVTHPAPDNAWRKLTWWLRPDTRRLTVEELEKLIYILATGQHH